MSRRHHETTYRVSIEKIFTNFNSLFFTGVDEKQRPQCVCINDFRPHFLIANPDNNSTDVQQTILNNHFDIKEDEEDYIVRVKSEHRIPFYGYTNQRRDHLNRIYIRNLRTQLAVIKQLQAKRYTLFHHEVKPALMFLHETNLRYGDWISLEADSCSTTHYLKMDQITKVTCTDISRIMKCFIRHIAIPQKVFATKETSFVEPNTELTFDRVVSVSLDFAWIDMKATEHAEHVLLTTMPPLPLAYTHMNVIHCKTEQEVLEMVRTKIQEWAPEDIIECNDTGDNHHTLLYLFRRAATLGIEPNPISQLEVMGEAKLYVNKKDPGPAKYTLQTRNLTCLVHFLRRKPFIPVETYTLYEFATMSRIVSEPREWCDLPWKRHLMNDWWRDASTWVKVQERLLLETELMRQIEFGLQMRVELHEIQKTNFTDFSDTANRGEQIRATNAVMYFINYEGYYLNPQILNTTKPLLVKLVDYPETYPPVSSIPLNEETRRRKCDDFAKLLPVEKQHKKAKAELEEDKCQGGNVIIPTPGFYQHDIIGVLDFQSLYPNIIRYGNLSHDCIVMEARYNDLPNVKYITIAVDSVHGIRFAQNTEGIIAKVETQSLAKRKEAKKMMQNEKDPFLYTVFDFKQQSLKILCNAIYGALGASVGKYFLTFRPLMTAVTSVGRYLQTKTSEYLATRYGLVTVYGDTDSVMVVMQYFRECATIEERVAHMAAYYQMPANFYTPSPQGDLTVETRAAIFVVMSKLCTEIDNMFGKPIVLEPENIALNMMLTDLKKHYWYQCVESKNPGKVKEIKIKGMANNKRGWCIWVKDLMDKCIDLMAKNRPQELRPLIIEYLDNLRFRRVSWEHLAVSSKYKGHLGTKDGYKSVNNNIYQMCTQISKLTGHVFTPGVRLKFLVRKGDEPFYKRCVCTDYTPDPNTIKVDLLHYLEKQFYNNMAHLCLYHKDHVDIDALYKLYYERIHHDESKQYCL